MIKKIFLLIFLYTTFWLNLLSYKNIMFNANYL